MANIDIRLSQSTVDQIHQISTGSSASLSEGLGLLVQLNHAINDAYDWASSWTSGSGKVTLNYLDGTTTVFKGQLFPYDAYSGYAIATSRTVTLSNVFKESITGTMNFFYDAYGSLSYWLTGTTVINKYKFESLVSDVQLGKTSIGFDGAVNINSSNGAVSGAISKFTSTASKFVTETIEGSISVTGQANLPSSMAATGSLSRYRADYKDGSLVDITGNFSLQADTALDASVFRTPGLWGGNDTVQVSLPAHLYQEFVISTGAGEDVITASGGGGMLFVQAGSGNDEIVLMDAMPWVDGGANTDTVKSALISLNLASYSGIENATLTGTKALNLTGDGSANVLTGNSAANLLDGAGGTDSLIGGAGNDTYHVDHAGDAIADTAGIELVKAWVPWTLSTGLENLTLMGSSAIDGTGNSAKNILTGNEAANSLSGDAGDDTLNGMAGNDWLDGGSGADKMAGGLDDDTYVVDDAKDSLTELANQGQDLVRTSLPTFSLATLTAIENLRFTGVGSAILTGNALANNIIGGAGNDEINAGAGADTMTGAAGNDRYTVDHADDRVVEASNGGTDTVLASVSHALLNNVENLTLTGKAAINSTGNDFANVLTGNQAANTLAGGEGADTLAGGLGNDVLTGGSGADVFLFNTTLAMNVDTLTDFVSGTDRIQLDDAIFKKFKGLTGQIGAGNFVVGGASVKALDANDHLVFNSQTRELFYDADGSGSAAMVKVASFTGVGDPAWSDFWIV